MRYSDAAPSSSMTMPNLYITSFSTDIGPVHISATNKGICTLEIGRPEQTIQFSNIPVGFMNDENIFREIKTDVMNYLQGIEVDFSRHRLDILAGTPFQRKVWETLKSIPYGSTMNYRKVAELAGTASGCRAVGNACNKNPVAIIIPCHRVIKSDGTTGGYASGAGIKERLLHLESRSGVPDSRSVNKGF